MSGDATHRVGVSNKAALVGVLVAFVVGIVASLALRPPSAQIVEGGDGTSLERVRWRVPVAFGTHLPALGDNILYVAERVSKASGGAVVFDVYEPGKLVPPFSITDGVKDKKIQAGYTWVGYDQGKIPSSAMFAARPFGMEPWEYAAWWYEGEGQPLAEEIYGEHNVHPILCGLIGPETAGWFRDEIVTLDDFDGRKIRFAGLGGKVLQRLGASVTMIPGGEIAQALDKGAIDGTEFSMPAIDQNLGFDRIVKFNYFPGWHQTYTAFHLLVNKEIWTELGEPTRTLIDTACTASVIRNLAHGEAIQAPILAGFPDKGVKAAALPLPLLRDLSRVTAEVMKEEAAADPWFQRVYESQEKFAAEYQAWKRLAYLPRDFADTVGDAPAPPAVPAAPADDGAAGSADDAAADADADAGAGGEE